MSQSLFDIRRSLALLGVGAWIAALAIPFICYMFYQQSTASPRLTEATFSAGETIHDTTTLYGTSIWAQPAGVELSTIECIAFDSYGKKIRSLPIGEPDSGPTTVSDRRGTFVFLTMTETGVGHARTAKCTGPSLEKLTTSPYVDRDGAKKFAIFGPIAIPFLYFFGRTVRRSGARVSGRHIPAPDSR